MSTVLIKKYGNRRLYDTRQSGYITLEDLAQIVRSGATVQVVEASSNQDITRQVLTQVILDQQERLDLLPLDLLHAIIRAQGTLEQAPLAAYLSLITRQFLEDGSRWTQHVSSLLGGLTTFSRPTGSEAVDDGEPERPTEDPAKDTDAAELRARMSALLLRLDPKG